MHKFILIICAMMIVPIGIISNTYTQRVTQLSHSIGSGEPRVYTVDDHKTGFLISCANRVEERLADPDGFRVVEQMVAEQNGKYTVLLNVVGKNSVGALVPAMFTCEGRTTGNARTITSIEQH